MSANDHHRALRDDELQALVKKGCTAADWSRVVVANPFLPDRVRNAHFLGDVKIGSVEGTVTTGTGIAKPAGIYDALIVNCAIGRGTRIAKIGRHLANYQIGDGVCIEDVGTLETRPGATFGNGLEIEVVNEAGGRTLVLFDTLCAQVAHLMCMHRYRPQLVARLTAMARAAAARARADVGRVGNAAQITSVTEIVDVNVGEHAVVSGCAALVAGTILSTADAPSVVGSGVQANGFIIAEGTEVTSGALLSKTYVGQGCQIGKQFSAENSAFFANCEGFYGEACSVLAGPYTVTHHKSTLLIAGMFSFYNAGSGTNQSNHMYKLGPLHEGKLERGCKTGSFAYMMWPCRVGPFSVILGKHKGTFDTADFPFSIIDAAPDGRCTMIPGLNLATVGTVRDGAKWPSRDRRKGSVRRDRISFGVLSPLTVGRMRNGLACLDQLQQRADRSADTVSAGGTQIKRVLLRTGQKFYRTGIQMYLLENVMARAERALVSRDRSLRGAFRAAPDAVLSEDWIDVGGQLMPRGRLDRLAQQIEDGAVADLDTLAMELDTIHAAYADDEWVWVKNAYRQVFGEDLDQVTTEELQRVAERLLDVKTRFLKQVLADASREFDNLSRTGFGQDGGPEDAARDFVAVRGEFSAHRFVKEMEENIEALKQRVREFQQALAGREPKG